MAKKRRTAAQKRATRKMIAANRRKRRGTKSVRRSGRRSNPWTGSRKQLAAARRNIKKAAAGKRRRKACRRAAGRRGAAKRLRRAMPRMPKACRPKRSKGRRRSSKRARGHGESHAKRVRAGRKGARTRKARAAHKRLSGGIGSSTYGTDLYYSENPRRRRRRRKGKARRRRNPLANPLPNPVRRRRRRYGRRRNPVHHRHHSHRHHRHPFMRRYNPIANPLGTAGEIVSGILGVGSGYAFADAIDRMLATHPLQANAAGNGFTDTPGNGQIFNSEAPLLPLWQNPVRLGAAVAVIFVPGIASRFFRGPKIKTFLQLAAYGAAAKVGGKLIADTIATTMSSQGIALQLYGPEIAASARLQQVGGGVPVPMQGGAAGTSPTQPAGFFAGPPKSLPSATGLGDCVPNSPVQPTAVVTDPLAAAQAQHSGQPNVYTDSAPWNMPGGNYNPLDPMGEGQDCLPLPMQQPQLNQLPGGTVNAPCPPGQITMPDGSCAPPPVQASPQMPAAPVVIAPPVVQSSAPQPPTVVAPPSPPVVQAPTPTAPPMVPPQVPSAPQPYLPR